MHGKIRHEIGDEHLSVAIGRAFGFTHDETAEFSGVSRSSARRFEDPRERDTAFQAVFSRVAAALSLYKSRAVTDAVSTVVGTAEQRIARLFDDVFLLTERLVRRAKLAGDEISMKDLLVIHNEITKWAARYVASEAPKRLELTSEHTETHKIDETTLDRLEGFMSKHQAFFTQEEDGRDDQLQS